MHRQFETKTKTNMHIAQGLPDNLKLLSPSAMDGLDNFEHASWQQSADEVMHKQSELNHFLGF